MRGAKIRSIRHISCYTTGSTIEESKKVIVPNGEPIYSAYTKKQVWTGPMPYGIKGDAPIGHEKYGKNFHGIIINGKGEYMSHDWQSMKK